MKEDKNKQIEEMSDLINKTLFEYLDKENLSCKDVCDLLAKDLLEHYQQKIPEDSVVLSREELQKLKHYESEMFRLQGVVDELTNYGWDILDEKEEKIRKAERKETAEKYICWLKENILFFGICGNGKLKGNISITLDQLEKFSKQFGDFSDKFIAKAQIKE